MRVSPATGFGAKMQMPVNPGQLYIIKRAAELEVSRSMAAKLKWNHWLPDLCQWNRCFAFTYPIDVANVCKYSSPMAWSGISFG